MERRYIKSFQGLRCMAALLVFLEHCGYFQNSKGENIFGFAGALAVCIFFMLSGFLSQMKCEGGVSAKGKKRGKDVLMDCKDSFIKALKKYYPLHLMTLLLVIPMWVKRFISTPSYAVSALFANLFLVQSWVPIRYFAQTTFNGVSWFLSTELFLMAMSPLVVRFLSKRKNSSAVCIAVGIIIFQTAISFLVNDLEIGNWIVYVFPPMRLLDFILGAIVCKVSMTEKRRKPLKSVSEIAVILSITLCVVAKIFSTSKSHMVYYTAYWSVPSFLLVYCFARFEKSSLILKWIFSNPAAVFLGNVSYEFFLLHMVVWGYGARGFKFFNIQNGLLLVCLVFFVSLIASIMLYLLKTYFFKKKKTVAAETIETEKPEETAADVPVEPDGGSEE